MGNPMPLETPITKRRSVVGLKRANNGGLPIAARHYCTKNFFAPPGCPRWSNNTWNPKGVLKPKYEYMLPLYPDRKWGVPAIHMVVSELRQYAKANNRTDILEAVPPYTDPRPKLGHEARVASLRAKALAEGRQDVLDAVPEMTPENIERWQAFEEILEDQTEADADEKKTKLKGKVAAEMVVTGLGDLAAEMNFSFEELNEALVSEADVVRVHTDHVRYLCYETGASEQEARNALDACDGDAEAAKDRLFAAIADRMSPTLQATVQGLNHGAPLEVPTTAAPVAFTVVPPALPTAAVPPAVPAGQGMGYRSLSCAAPPPEAPLLAPPGVTKYRSLSTETADTLPTVAPTAILSGKLDAMLAQLEACGGPAGRIRELLLNFASGNDDAEDDEEE